MTDGGRTVSRAGVPRGSLIVSAREWQRRLDDAGMNYELLENHGRFGPTILRHRPSGEVGQVTMGSLVKGIHPSWSPECTKPKNQSKEWVNRRLEGTGYELVDFFSASSHKNTFRHIESGCEGKGFLSNIKKGHHPGWSPACAVPRDLSRDEWNTRLASQQVPYEILRSGGSIGESFARHIPSGKSGPVKINRLLQGKHPRWSPETGHPQDDCGRTLVYLCTVSYYGRKEVRVFEPHFTVGVTKGTVRNRYKGALIEVLETTPRGSGMLSFEKQVLSEFRLVFGEAGTGHEAWKEPTPERIEEARRLFRETWKRREKT
jgi:hypothetical protein